MRIWDIVVPRLGLGCWHLEVELNVERAKVCMLTGSISVKEPTEKPSKLKIKR